MFCSVSQARISNYGGKSLTTASTTTLEVDPDDSRAFEVKNWWLQGGQTGRGIGRDSSMANAIRIFI